MTITLGEQEIDGKKYSKIGYGENGEIIWGEPVLGFMVYKCAWCRGMSRLGTNCEKCGAPMPKQEGE